MLLAFEQLGLNPTLIQAVEKLGYEQPTPIQQSAIPALLEGRNVLGQAQTGTGKTAAFVLPMLQTIQPGSGAVQALVLAPTRELAIQVAEAATSMSRMSPVKVLAVYGGQSYEIQKRQLKRGVDVVVGTPGRLLDLMRQKVLDLSQVRYLVLDEADEMLEMGFIEDVETILAEVPAERQMALFSATLPHAIRKLADRYLTDPQVISINPSRPTVAETEQIFYRVREEDKLPALIRLLETEEVTSALIFARTKMRAQELADELVRRGYPAESLHGDLSQSRREYVLKKFRQHTVNLLVATDVAARGLDIENMSHVFNYDVPGDSDDYVHRIGRTGRAGRKGIAITLFTLRERFRQRQIEEYTKQPITERPVPTLEAIAAKRDERMAEKLFKKMMEGGIDRERELIAGLVAGGYDPIEVAAAALKLVRASESSMPTENVAEVVEEPRRKRGAKFGDARSQDRPTYKKGQREKAGEPRREDRGESRGEGRREPKGATGTMIRLWMNLGNSHGLRPADVVGAIAGEVGIPGRAIGEIDIHTDHTFVDVSEKHVRQILRQSSGNYFLRGKPVLLKIAE